MGITIEGQAAFLLTSCLLGAALGALYDLFRIYRVMFRSGPAAVFFQDLLFWLLCAALTFGFLLARNDGRLRGPGFLAEALGAALWYNTLGVLVQRGAKRAEQGVKRRAGAAARAAARPLRRGAQKAASAAEKCGRRARRFAKKESEVFKIRLQVRRAMMYNLLRPTKKPEGKNGQNG